MHRKERKALALRIVWFMFRINYSHHIHIHASVQSYVSEICV